MTRPPSPSIPTWITTVDELVRIFRDALAAVAPVLERAQIHSDELRAYDDWDAIADALFQNIVVRSIQWSEQAFHDIDLGRYATLSEGRAQTPQLLVRDGSSNEWNVFHSIVSRRHPFDSVTWLKSVGVAGETSYDRAHFALQVPGRDGLIETLEVQL